MVEWNMGHTANYAELAMLMTPRPFMVERGHDDGVAPDEWVAWEYAKVRRHYDKLGIWRPDRNRILQRSAHDQRAGDVPVPGAASELARNAVERYQVIAAGRINPCCACPLDPR